MSMYNWFQVLSKALGKDEGAPARCEVVYFYGGYASTCGQPLPCPDHPQSTKEVASDADLSRGRSSGVGVGDRVSPVGEGQGTEVAAATAEPGASATPLRDVQISEKLLRKARWRALEAHRPAKAPRPPDTRPICAAITRRGNHCTQRSASASGLCNSHAASAWNRYVKTPGASREELLGAVLAEAALWGEGVEVLDAPAMRRLGQAITNAIRYTPAPLPPAQPAARQGFSWASTAAMIANPIPSQQLGKEGVGAAPEGEQEERACYHCDAPVMVPAGSPRIYTCGQCEDSAPDLSEVFAPPSATERQDSPARAAPKAGETQPPSADELGKLLDRAAPGADYLAASLRGQFPMRAEAAGPPPSEFEPCPACGGRAENHGTMGDCPPAAAVPEAGALEALKAIRAKAAQMEANRKAAPENAAHWIAKRDGYAGAAHILGTALSSPSGDARPPQAGSCFVTEKEEPGSAAAQVSTRNQAAAAQSENAAALAPFILEEPKSPIVDPKAASQKEVDRLNAELRRLDLALGATKRLARRLADSEGAAINSEMRARADLLSEKQRADAAEAEVLRLTKEAEHRDRQWAIMLDQREEARASAKALREALVRALDWAGHHDEHGMHWIASEQFMPEDCPCAARAPPHPSAEKLTPGPRE